MAMYLFWLSLILFEFQSTDALGQCPLSGKNRATRYLWQQNHILDHACVVKEPPHFTPISFKNWQNFSDPIYQRAFKLISSSIEYNAAMKAELSGKTLKNLKSGMSDVYHNAKICSKEDNITNENGCIKKWSTEMYGAFERTNNSEERKHYWTAWRDATGRKMRQFFEENYEVLSKPLLDNQYWLKEYETSAEELFKDLDKVWVKLVPLYKQLHAYIRRQLIKIYGEEIVRSNGPIPEHLLDLFAKDWWALENSVQPYEEEKDLINRLQERNMEFSQVADICDKFYESLGFPPLGEEFWENVKQIYTDEPNCQNSVFAGCNGYDSSMTICRKKDNDDYVFFYFMIENLINVYKEKWVSRNQPCGWPKILNDYPNPGFESAMVGIIDISVSTRNFTKDIGLHDETESWQPEEEYVLNNLMKMAVWSFVSLQYYYNIAKWRMDLFNGLFQVQEMNTKWWEYSLNYRGVCPPVKRSELDFDPGALVQIAENLPVVSDFLGGIYQYQFHEALCNITGKTASLQTCNIYKSKESGDKLREMMKIGKSIPWQNTINIMTNGESEQLDAQPLIDYYQPLYNWLKEQNKDEYIGWESNDATICP